MADTARFMTVFCLFAVIVPCALAGEAAPADIPQKAPRIEVETPELDLGQVIRGEIVEGAFTVRNTGSEVLQIIKVKPG